MGQAFLHLRRLPLVNLLHLAVLITNDRDVLLSQASLLSELLLESERLVDIVLLGLGLRLLRMEAGCADLLSHCLILLANLFKFLLLLALFELMSGKCVNMILNYLLVENLCLVNLTHELIYSSLVMQVALSLLLLKMSLLVSKLHQKAFMVSSLSLYLLIQVIIAIFHLTNFLVRKVDCAQDIWLGCLRATARSDGDSWHLLAALRLYGLIGSSPPNITHILLLCNIGHRLGCVVRDLLRFLLIVVVDVLLY